MKKRLFTIVAVVMAVLMASLTPIQTIAAPKNEYISEIRMSDSKDKLTELGYTVLDKDLNAGTGESYTYIGYKTTTNPDEAITDIAIMDMKGGYSFSDYEAMLEQQRNSVTERLSTYRIAINEFTEKYKSGSKAAALAFENLNYYVEDDSGRLIGDMLIDPDLSNDDLIKMFMQGTVLINSVIADCLAIGLASDGEENWMSRIAKNEQSAPEAYDEAMLLMTSIEQLRGSLNEYFDSELKLTDEEPDSDALDKLKNDRYLEFMENGIIYETLSMYDYKDGTVADLFMSEDYEIEDYYPLIAALTPGQLAIARICGFESLIKSASVTDNLWEDAKAQSQELINDVYGEDGVEKVSIYTGVDRDMYMGGVALTSDALRKSSSTGDNSWWNGNISLGAEVALCLTAIISGGFAIAFYAAYSSYLATYTTLAPAYIYGNFATMYSQAIAQAEKFGVRFMCSYETYAASQLSELLYAQSIIKIANIAMWISIAIVCVAIGLYIGLEVYNYYNPDYTEIPLVLMDLKFGENDDIGDWEKYIKYNVVLNEGGTAGDLNGFAAKQWNAMYVTKDKAAGSPIEADSFAVQYFDSTTPRNYLPVHYFGSADAFNLNSHCYDDDVEGIFMFFRSDDKAFASETASVFGNGTLTVVTGFGGLVIGALGTLIFTKKKKETAAEV